MRNKGIHAEIPLQVHYVCRRHRSRSLCKDRTTRTICALLTCLNIADQYAKDKVSSANLRQQIKDLLEENAQLKLELHQAKHPRQDKNVKK